MTAVDIVGLEAMLAAGSALPWQRDAQFGRVEGKDIFQCVGPSPGRSWGEVIANARLIVAAVNNLPSLLTEIVRLRAADEAYMEALRCADDLNSATSPLAFDEYRMVRARVAYQTAREKLPALAALSQGDR